MVFELRDSLYYLLDLVMVHEVFVVDFLGFLEPMVLLVELELVSLLQTVAQILHVAFSVRPT